MISDQASRCEIGTADFQCGNAALDAHIRRYASQDVRRNVASLPASVFQSK